MEGAPLDDLYPAGLPLQSGEFLAALLGALIEQNGGSIEVDLQVYRRVARRIIGGHMATMTLDPKTGDDATTFTVRLKRGPAGYGTD